LWAGSRAARVQITISGTANSLIYCVMFTVHTQFTNAAAWTAVDGLDTHDLEGSAY